MSGKTSKNLTNERFSQYTGRTYASKQQTYRGRNYGGIFIKTYMKNLLHNGISGMIGLHFTYYHETANYNESTLEQKLCCRLTDHPSTGVSARPLLVPYNHPKQMPQCKSRRLKNSGYNFQLIFINRINRIKHCERYTSERK
jgi:hypothetical protein